MREFTPGKYSVFTVQQDESCGQSEEEGEGEGKGEEEEEREGEGMGGGEWEGEGKGEGEKNGEERGRNPERREGEEGQDSSLLLQNGPHSEPTTAVKVVPVTKTQGPQY